MPSESAALQVQASPGSESERVDSDSESQLGPEPKRPADRFDFKFKSCRGRTRRPRPSSSPPANLKDGDSEWGTAPSPPPPGGGTLKAGGLAPTLSESDHRPTRTRTRSSRGGPGSTRTKRSEAPWPRGTAARCSATGPRPSRFGWAAARCAGAGAGGSAVDARGAPGIPAAPSLTRGAGGARASADPFPSGRGDRFRPGRRWASESRRRFLCASSYGASSARPLPAPIAPPLFGKATLVSRLSMRPRLRHFALLAQRAFIRPSPSLTEPLLGASWEPVTRRRHA
jgi:hypothetical protein